MFTLMLSIWVISRETHLCRWIMWQKKNGILWMEEARKKSQKPKGLIQISNSLRSFHSKPKRLKSKTIRSRCWWNVFYSILFFRNVPFETSIFYVKKYALWLRAKTSKMECANEWKLLLSSRVSYSIGLLANFASLQTLISVLNLALINFCIWLFLLFFFPTRRD